MAIATAYAARWLLSCALLYFSIAACRAHGLCTGGAGTVQVEGDCVLERMLEPGVSQYGLFGSGAAVVFASGSSSESPPLSSALQLSISGVTLANFTLAASAAGSPLLWPLEAVGAAPAAGSTVEMTDVRLVVPDGTLQTFLKVFRSGPAIYTVRGLLKSVSRLPLRSSCCTTVAHNAAHRPALWSAASNGLDTARWQVQELSLESAVLCIQLCRTTLPTYM
jgi:hypothetical protein